MNRRNILVSLAVGVAISAVALYYAFRNIPFGQIWSYFGTIHYVWALPAALAITASFALRVVRWKLILGPMLPTRFWEAWHPTMIGFAMNCILPGRVGEFARPTILAKERGASFFGIFATVAAERVFDLASLLILFAVVAMTVQIDPDFRQSFGSYTLSRDTLSSVSLGMVRLVLVVLLGMILVSVRFTRDLMARAIIKSPEFIFFLSPAARDKVCKKACEPAVQLMERIAQGFDMVKSPVRIALCLLLSFLVWGLLGLSWWILAQGCPGVDMTFFQLTAAMVIVCFFISLPSVPGFWGLWEAGGMFAMTLFGVASSPAAGFTLVNHVLQTLPVILLGLVSAVIKGVNLFSMNSPES